MPQFTDHWDVTLHNITLRIHSERKDVLQLFQTYTDQPSLSAINDEPHINVVLSFKKFDHDRENLRKISRNIYIGPSTVLINSIERYPNLSIKAERADNTLLVEACYQEQRSPTWKKIMTYLRRTKHRSFFDLAPMIYFLYYFLIFYYAERFKNLNVLHAAGFEYKNKGIILTGLGGVGKSTFVTGILSLNECKFISDNLLLCDESRIYAVPEPVALDATALSRLPDQHHYLVSKNLPSTHNRNYYRIAPQFTVPLATPHYMFWCQWGSENKVIPMDTRNAVNSLVNINYLARELREYYTYASAFDLAFWENSDFSAGNMENIHHLLASLDCYILVIKPGDDVRNVFEQTIGKIIK